MNLSSCWKEQSGTWVQSHKHLGHSRTQSKVIVWKSCCSILNVILREIIFMATKENAFHNSPLVEFKSIKVIEVSLIILSICPSLSPVNISGCSRVVATGQ